MAAIILYKTKDRDDSHKKLEEILAAGEHPKAECREGNEDGNYTVWSGAQRDGSEGAPAPMTAEAALANLDDTQLAKLADLISARMKGG